MGSLLPGSLPHLCRVPDPDPSVGPDEPVYADDVQPLIRRVGGSGDGPGGAMPLDLDGFPRGHSQRRHVLGAYPGDPLPHVLLMGLGHLQPEFLGFFRHPLTSS